LTICRRFDHLSPFWFVAVLTIDHLTDWTSLPNNHATE